MVRRTAKWAAVALAGSFAVAGGMVLAAQKPPVLLQSKLFGNIPNVTIRGVSAAPYPWVVVGHVKLTRTHLFATGKWLIIPPGLSATGKPVPSAIAGTTAGVPKVVAEVTDAEGAKVVTAPVVLSRTGSFTVSAPIHLTGPVEDPVVLIGPPGSGKTMGAWFAATNFLAEYGVAKPGMLHTAKKGSSGSGSTYGSTKTKAKSSGKGSGGW